ncbi:MAG TPA: methyltransferase [Terriglobales bacterium]|nr:methyltransferase [Terriglobales bacterium]
MRQMFVKTTGWSLGYLGLAVACVIQWKSPHPWMRIDWFAGTYFGLRLLGSFHSVVSGLGAFRSRALRHEWWGTDSDPQGPQWVMVLMALDLLVFLDYGHWHLSPGLTQPALQTAGIALYLAVTFWQIWTDFYLARYFNRNGQPLTPMNCGPYRYVRHPRYAAAMMGKIAMALTFGSIFGWALALAWGMLLLNKISVEEKHLHEMFGIEYESYARITAKVLPGIY